MTELEKVAAKLVENLDPKLVADGLNKEIPLAVRDAVYEYFRCDEGRSLMSDIIKKLLKRSTNG